ncbi:MAG: protein-export chaperone SecB [Bacteroidota bacterium]
MDTPEQTSGLTLHKIHLAHSRFQYLANQDYWEKQFNSIKIGIELDKQPENAKLSCKLLISVIAIDENENEVAAIDVAMRGVFTFEEYAPVDLETFGNINAPAILYPFIREHITNISRKGDIKEILLPPINFVRMFQRKSGEQN